MLRSVAFALLGLSLLAGLAAARGGEGSAGSSGGRRAEATAAVRSAKTERAFFVRRVVSHGSRSSAQSGLACVRTRGSAERCRGGGAVQAVHWRWTQGLPPALGVQAVACPAGTMATLAEGHEDIVRCIPL